MVAVPLPKQVLRFVWLPFPQHRSGWVAFPAPDCEGFAVTRGAAYEGFEEGLKLAREMPDAPR